MIIRIKNIKALTVVGVYEEERKAPRPLIISLAIDYDHSKAVESDTVEHAIDYENVENTIVADLSQRQFHLIETVADHICRMMFANPLVQQVTVEIEKPGVMRFAESVSVIHSMVRE